MACRTGTRAGAIAIVSAAALLATAAPTAGQTPPPSAVDQYVEMVPSASGPSAPGTETRRTRPLPRAGKKALATAPPEIATPLEEIATSPDYGAPAADEESPRPAAPKPGEPRTEAAPAQPADTEVPPADRFTDATFAGTVSAVASTSADDERVLGLVAFMALTMLVAIVLAVRRARQLGS
jgi:hypothetical protein